MTGNTAYRDHAYQLAAYFLEHHSPVDAPELRLDDHGCEVISGLSEVYYIAAQQDPERHARWKPAMHRILDRILEVGRDENGLLYNKIDPRDGKILDQDRTDNWGYNYNAFLVVDQIDDVPRYREAVTFALRNLMANKDFPWEGDIADGIADSLEGGLNLMNRLPEPAAAEWADYMAARLLAKQRDTGVIPVRARRRRLRADGPACGPSGRPRAATSNPGEMTSASARCPMARAACRSPYPPTGPEGKLRFDVPRRAGGSSSAYGLPPARSVPEWFTVKVDNRFTVDGTATSGEALRAGLPVKVDGKTAVQLALRRTPLTDDAEGRKGFERRGMRISLRLLLHREVKAPAARDLIDLKQHRVLPLLQGQHHMLIRVGPRGWPWMTTATRR